MECKSSLAFKGFEEHSFLLLRLQELPELPFFTFPPFYIQLFISSLQTPRAPNLTNTLTRHFILYYSFIQESQMIAYSNHIRFY